MTGAVGPGDWVECIEAFGDLPPDIETPDGVPVVKSVYRVLTAMPCTCANPSCDGMGLKFASPRVFWRGQEYAWAGENFRPTGYDPTGVIEGLKEPVPIVVVFSPRGSPVGA